MAIMTAADREKARRAFTEDAGQNREAIGVTRPDLVAAAAAVDQWVSDNAASFNTALPVASRNGLTAPQKARLLLAVVRQRFLSGV